MKETMSTVGNEADKNLVMAQEQKVMLGGSRDGLISMLD